jgi:cell division septum initiation protein DivIVA
MDTRLQRIDELEQENAALKEVNDILRKAVAYYTRSLSGLANALPAARTSSEVLDEAAASHRFIVQGPDPGN